MQLVAINENVAAFTPGKSNRLPDPRIALNKLLTVSSWRELIDFLKKEGCNDLFAKREREPLREYDADCYENDLSGSLMSRIDKDSSIDYLDKLTRDDLVSQGPVYEINIAELIDYCRDLSRFLTLAAISLGFDVPDDLCSEFRFDQVDCAFSQDFNKNIEDFFDEYFGNHGQIKALSFNGEYWLDTENGPFWYYGPFDEHFDKSCQKDFHEERSSGILAGTAYFGVDSFGNDQDFDLIFYDSSRHGREDACRLFCGLSVARFIDETIQKPINDGPYDHDYVDEPDFEQRTSFDLAAGYKHPRLDSDFERWQLVLVEVAEQAVFDKRISLCPICKTPIVTKSDKSRIEYCCESHKTIASKQRRERAHQLYYQNVPLEDAIAEIGEPYSRSVDKWYREARSFNTRAQ